MHRKDNVYLFRGPKVFVLAMQVFTMPSGVIDADRLFHPLNQSINQTEWLKGHTVQASPTW